ncbi:MAG: C-terminal binding protein [Clostridiales bacterium]|nr:C-terminal binding protein [Clostridiales bacterium]
MAKKVVYVDYIFKNEEVEKKLFNEAGIDYINASEKPIEEQIEICSDADGVVSTFTLMDEKFISHLKKCKVLVRTGIGFNTIDIEAASDKNIMVANVRDYCIDEVADHAVALSMALIRKLSILEKSIKDKKSWSVNDARPIQRISTQTVCLYGLGATGKSYASKMKAIGFKVVAYDPYQPDEIFEDLGIERETDLDSLFKKADIISIHVPLNDDTYHSVNEKMFSMMKDSAYIINVSRGEIIKEVDLVAALKANKIAGAGLDVLESENPDLSDEIFSLDNVIITPHVAYYSEGSEDSLQELSAMQAILAINEGEPTYLVNRKQLGK